jgi:hypothetical protein
MAWELSGMNGISAEGLKQMLDSLSPTEKQNLDLYNWYLAMGKIPPQALTDAMSATETLQALTGQLGVDGMYYAIGQQMASSPEITAMVLNGQISAELLPNAMILGMKSKIPDLQLFSGKLVSKSDSAVATAAKNSAEKNMPGYSGMMVSNFKKTFDNDTTAVSSVKTWLDSINTAIANWKIPEVKIPTVYETLFEEKYKQPYLNGGTYAPKQYAVGGMPDYGQMFIAREAGPELVGSVGRHTTVMNNDQIVSSVSQGVAGAVASVIMPIFGAMNSNKSSGDVVLMVGERELGRVALSGIQGLNGRFNPSVVPV